MHPKQNQDHSSRQHQIGVKGAPGHPQAMRHRTKQKTPDRDRRERAPKHAHGAPGEVKDMAKREVVQIRVGAQQAIQRRAWWG